MLPTDDLPGRCAQWVHMERPVGASTAVKPALGSRPQPEPTSGSDIEIVELEGGEDEDAAAEGGGDDLNDDARSLKQFQRPKTPPMAPETSRRGANNAEESSFIFPTKTDDGQRHPALKTEAQKKVTAPLAGIVPKDARTTPVGSGMRLAGTRPPLEPKQSVGGR